ncbi:hypothetical protein LAJ19_03005 [Deinococcus taeanensis]|uniref:hypothetical protein n=1 Tax=Deinococcus taeanensis TaxID=2737050 RepID=UPI001CDBF95B|nr:hypothetical protein [Deinococcus taeanensis]UBV43205.1 hypothetical protein LAJ19_03005 [Deinococcus taeanensis]
MPNVPSSDPLTPIKGFVNGKLNPSDFAAALYTDSELEQLLRDAKSIPPYSTSQANNLFQFLIELNFTRTRDIRNAQDALSALLSAMGEPHAKSEALASRAHLLLNVQPKWLDLDEDDFNRLVQDAGNRHGQELRAWLKAEVRRRFRYVSHPPKWLQAPRWPVREGNPLIFVGQLSLNGLLHDNAQVYVFMWKGTGEIETVVQTA